jgi:Na+-translocating ferredoxin:NAD+ oxidoreductase RnfG subunit
MAKFFKSVWFKCITCLLVILLLSGASISILSNLLYVSPKERTDRSIAKIYGEVVDYTPFREKDINPNNQYKCVDFGYIDTIYLVGDKNSDEFDYLFHVTGEHGFKGHITYWVKLTSNKGVLSIGSMVIESNKGESFIGVLDSSWHSGLYVQVQGSKYLVPEKFYDNQINFTPIPTTGATNSKRASCNAVNCIIYFVSQGELA